MNGILELTAKVVDKNVSKQYINLDTPEAADEFWNGFEATVWKNGDNLATAFNGGMAKGVLIGVGCGIIGTIGTILAVRGFKGIKKEDTED